MGKAGCTAGCDERGSILPRNSQIYRKAAKVAKWRRGIWVIEKSGSCLCVPLRPLRLCGFAALRLCGFAALRLCGEKLAVTCLVTSAPRGFWCYKGKWNWKKAAFFTTNYTDFIGFHGEDACVLSNCGVHGFQMTPFRVLLGSVSAYGARRPRR